ncbi:helix-turn-helix transcriptional regulator [Mongoliibacter ruber]|uniref:HTH luxR-type domain-containing protein n=1 Tax=Mongoliibacter ruber TaxID=1750599 RepID=A0A2T0WDN8_9BACT|nr:hypothetical protein [Mongoliibacter ruber]PRY84785.1 hypothetical protein CLW00_11762 [Mongoliibacter ruber]
MINNYASVETYNGIKRQKYNSENLNQSFENKSWVKFLLQEGNGGLFITEFVERYPNFVLKLETLIPDLNSMDFKICALMRLDFFTKEIAELTYSTVRAVESRKYRIRKKIGVESHIDLNLYMVQLIKEDY